MSKIRTLTRVKEIWRELDYAQRRLLEIQTGIPFTSERGKMARSDQELERLLRAPSRS